MDANAEELRSLKWLLLYQIKRAVRCDAFGKAQALADLFNTLEYGQLNASDPLVVDETSERLGAGTLVETEES